MKIKAKATPRKNENVKITTEFIRLDAFLKFKGIAETGGYIAGRHDLVELCGYRLTSPGIR